MLISNIAVLTCGEAHLQIPAMGANVTGFGLGAALGASARPGSAGKSTANALVGINDQTDKKTVSTKPFSATQSNISTLLRIASSSDK